MRCSSRAARPGSMACHNKCDGAPLAPIAGLHAYHRAFAVGRYGARAFHPQAGAAIMEHRFGDSFGKAIRASAGRKAATCRDAQRRYPRAWFHAFPGLRRTHCRVGAARVPDHVLLHGGPNVGNSRAPHGAEQDVDGHDPHAGSWRSWRSAHRFMAHCLHPSRASRYRDTSATPDRRLDPWRRVAGRPYRVADVPSRS